jgi:hypothetical protein
MASCVTSMMLLGMLPAETIMFRKNLSVFFYLSWDLYVLFHGKAHRELNYTLLSATSNLDWREYIFLFDVHLYTSKVFIHMTHAYKFCLLNYHLVIL